MLAITRKSRILSVVYNASNNEFVRTNTLVKNSIVQIDATPFRQWYEQHYGLTLVKKKKGGKVRSIQILHSSLYSSLISKKKQPKKRRSLNTFKLSSKEDNLIEFSTPILKSSFQ